MPHLSDPKVIAAKRTAVTEVAQTRSVLTALGDRPDHESVDSAKAKLAAIDASRDADAAETEPANEEECDKSEEENKEGDDISEQVDEEVVRILQQASVGTGPERVDLSERGLRLLPEEFGRISGLIHTKQ